MGVPVLGMVGGQCEHFGQHISPYKYTRSESFQYRTVYRTNRRTVGVRFEAPGYRWKGSCFRMPFTGFRGAISAYRRADARARACVPGLLFKYRHAIKYG